MTTITIKKDFNIITIHAKGHSGYAKKGSDIVCASISTAMLLSYKILNNLKILSGYKMEPSKTYQRMQIAYFDKDGERVVDGLIEFYEELAAAYPENLRVKKYGF